MTLTPTQTLNHHLSPFRTTRSRHLLLSRAQSTISVCALLLTLTLTLLLFAISSLEHSPRLRSRSLPRYLDTVPFSSFSLPLPILWRRRSTELKAVKPRKLPPTFALQGMGVLHRRGSHAMPGLIVGHVSQETTKDGLRLFLHALHHSGLTARPDVVLIFPDRSLLSSFGEVIRGENDEFLRLMDHHLQGNHTTVQGKTSAATNALNFEAAHFLKKSSKEKEAGEPLWEKRTRINYNKTGAADEFGQPPPSALSALALLDLIHPTSEGKRDGQTTKGTHLRGLDHDLWSGLHRSTYEGPNKNLLLQQSSALVIAGS